MITKRANAQKIRNHHTYRSTLKSSPSQAAAAAAADDGDDDNNNNNNNNNKKSKHSKDPYSPYIQVYFEVISLTRSTTVSVWAASCHFITEWLYKF